MYKRKSFVRRTAEDTWLFTRLAWFKLLRLLTPAVYLAVLYRLIKGW